MENLLNSKLFKPQKILGISCEIGFDGSYLWRYCLLKQNRKSIQLVIQNTISDIADLKKEKLSLVPVYLTIEGKGVLHKKVLLDSGNSSISQVIPNAIPDDFLVTEFAYTDAIGYTSIVRKEIVDAILEQLEKNGLSVIDVKAGSFHINKLHQWFDNLPQILVSANMEYTLDSLKHQIDFKKIDQTGDISYQIAGETINATFLSPFVAALSYFIEAGENNYPPIQKNKLNFLAHRLFVMGGWGILIAAFVVLLLNYMFLMNYTDKRNKLEKQVSGNSQYIIMLNNLKEELKQKEQFLSQSGFSEKSRYSFYADRIASTVPAGINLSGLSLNPLQSKIKKEKAIEFRKGIITLSGQTPNSIILNDWISDLEKYSWIGKISVIQYLQEQSGSFAEFLLEIELKK